MLGEIRTDISGLVLNREDLFADAWEKLSRTNLLEIIGVPGVGKSALLKALAVECSKHGAIMVLAGDRITGTGWSSYANQLQLTQPLNDLLLSMSSDRQVMIFIDGIDRINESGQRLVVKDLLSAITPLIHDEKEILRWVVVYSAREDNLQEVYQWLNWTALGKPSTIRVPELTTGELKEVAEHAPRLKSLLSLEQLSPLLQTPFMLRLLEDERMLPTAVKPPTLATELEISHVWWTKLISDGGSIHGRDRKNSLLKLGKQVVHSPGKPFPVEEGVSPESLISLNSDQILVNVPGRELYKFSHDLLEDWVMYRVLDQNRENLPDYLHEINEPLGLYRAVQLLGISLLECSNTAESWIQLIEAFESSIQISPRWRQAVLMAPLISPNSEVLLDKVETFLMADNAQRLVELMIVVRTLEVTPNLSLLTEEEKQDKDQWMPLLMSNPIPKWSTWQPFMGWLLDHIHTLPVSVRPEASKLMEIWQVNSPDNSMYREEIGKLAISWLQE